MRLPDTVVSLVCLLAVLCSLCSDQVDAGKKRRKLKRCVYKRQGVVGECNMQTGSVEVVYSLKSSRRKRNNCPPTKIKLKRCPGCRYPKKAASFGDCVEGYMAKVVPLGSGSQPDCPPFRTIMRRCHNPMAKRIRRKRACVYQSKDWSVCDQETNTRQKEKVLVSGSSESCLPKKMVTKKCRKACRYIKGDWSSCDEVTNMKNRTLEPKPGSLAQCEARVQEQPCFVGSGVKPGRATKCRYQNAEWSPCDLRTNTRTMVMTLKRGDPNRCSRTIKQSRKCKLACKFRKGEWSQCDQLTRLMTRVDTLVKGEPSQCEQTREITRKCRKAKCKYMLGDWSECDPDTNARTRLKTLMPHKSDQTGKCQPEVLISKPCLGKEGQVRCFFGAWGDFGPCTNGVMTRQRPLLQGGVECERKAVTAKACGD